MNVKKTGILIIMAAVWLLFELQSTTAGLVLLLCYTITFIIAHIEKELNIKRNKRND